jgi:hypothetical protein
MREYARISPKFWVGETGKQIRTLGTESQLLAMYLMTSPHSNMLGLYWCPTSYMAHETGLTLQGASKALQRLVDCGFCEYDDASEFVWVYEMAKYQIGDKLKETDKQSKGVQNAYEDLPRNPFLSGFYEKYAECFCMTSKRYSDSQSIGIRRGIEGASKALASKEKEKEKEKEQEQALLFDQFWKAYPRKLAKTDAQKAFVKLDVDSALMDTMLSAIEVQSVKWAVDDYKYTPYPATWLNNARWLDEVEASTHYKPSSIFAGAK